MFDRIDWKQVLVWVLLKVVLPLLGVGVTAAASVGTYVALTR